VSSFSTQETELRFRNINRNSREGMNTSAYPRSRIPTQPVLSLASFMGSGRRIPSVLDAEEVKFVTSGRIAIALALQKMKIGQNDKVLIPAYHCSSMIEPVLWAGATPVFYKINRDTSIDLDDIRSKLDATTKLLMATNYFGFPQNLSKIRAFCDTHAIFLLEDCAHSFLGEHAGKSVGSFGDYAIASSMKFFPIYEGGCLVSTRHSIDDVHLDSGGPGFELKAAFNELEKSFEYDRMPLLKAFLSIPLWLKNFVWRRIKETALSENFALGPGASDGGFRFESEWLNKRSSLFSRLLVKRVSKTRMAAKRRKHYLALHTALSDLPGCRPLFPEFPEGIYPWVFPLLTDGLVEIFPALKNAGVPVVRFGEFLWPGVDGNVCPVSVELSERVMQFPCHQDLRSDELDWMIGTIRSVLLSNGGAKK
jgi:perosamine synthetase